MTRGGAFLGIALIAACGVADAGEDEAVVAVAPIAPAPPAPVSCAAGVPAAACEPGLRVCRPGDRDQAGEWRFALVSAPFDPEEAMTRAALTEAWRAGRIDATDDTAAALAAVLGPRPRAARLDGRPAPTIARRALSSPRTSSTRAGA